LSSFIAYNLPGWPRKGLVVLELTGAWDLGLHRQRRVEYVDPTEQGQSVAGFSPLTAEQRAQLKECVEKLADTSRAILRAIYWDKESIADVAAAHGMQSESLCKCLYRIRRALGDCLEDSCWLAT
jgi:DNA-directed RNA polymerase specialized sigma24 family protein